MISFDVMRISKVTTKTGDGGKTGLGDGQRVSKSHPRIAFLGEVDELNTHIGFARVVNHSEIDKELEAIQHDLFDLGGEAAMPKLGLDLLGQDRIEFLEKRLVSMNKKLSPLKEFILPGGDEFAARLHMARAVCRRTERLAVALYDMGENTGNWIPYLNRLSDYLFVLIRFYTNSNNQTETQWKRN